MSTPDEFRNFAAQVFSDAAPADSLPIVRRMLKGAPFPAPGLAETVAGELARTPRAPVLLAIDAAHAAPAVVEKTLVSWALQAAGTPPIVVVPDKASAKQFDALCSAYRIPAPILRSEALGQTDGFVVLAQGGELFHPRLSRTLEGLPSSVAAVTWSVFVQDGESDGPLLLDNRQNRGPVALVGAQGAVGLAVRAGAADFQRAGGGLSLARQAQILAAGFPSRAWVHLMEGLSAVRFPEGFEAAARAWNAYDRDLPDAVARIAPEIEVRSENGVARFLLRRHASSIGAIIGVDSVEAGMASLRSLAEQRPAGRLTVSVVLSARLRGEDGGLSKIGRELFPDGRFSTLFFADDAPPALRLNQAAAGRDEEVLLFLRGGTSLAHSEAIDEMAAWALARDVGVVCCRIVESSGAESRYPNEGGWAAGRFGSPLLPRLACAAVSRSLWQSMGGFDDWRFGRSLFDLEYTLRLTRLGLQNLRLGHIAAKVHSAGEADDPAEAALLYATYPEIAGLKAGAAASLARALAESAGRAQAVDRTASRDGAAFLLDELLAARRDALASEGTRRILSGAGSRQS